MLCSCSSHSIGEKGRFSASLVTGAAEKAGVCKGDHLVWMDGATVSDLTHSALSRMVWSRPVTLDNIKGSIVEVLKYFFLVGQQMEFLK